MAIICSQLKQLDRARRLSIEAPILVTGAHRSGTTWVGRMLCASGEAHYVSEPFNVGKICFKSVKYCLADLSINAPVIPVFDLAVIPFPS